MAALDMELSQVLQFKNLNKLLNVEKMTENSKSSKKKAYKTCKLGDFYFSSENWLCLEEYRNFVKIIEGITPKKA